MKFTGGLPTISFRDLAIQRRENDLVGASFGRSFYVLDDYSFLREVSNEKLNQEGALFATRDAWWYIPRPVVGFSEKGNMGANYYTAKNPDFGATFTYYLKEDLKTDQQVRKEAEKESLKAGKKVGFPGWETMTAEAGQQAPMIWLTVRDGQGNVVRRLNGATTKGMHRLAWDLRLPATNSIALRNIPADVNSGSGVMVAPGTYTVTLSKQVDGKVEQLDDPVSFEVVPLRKGVLTGKSPQQVAEFWNSINEFNKKATALRSEMRNGMNRLRAMKVALGRSQSMPGNLDEQLFELAQALRKHNERLNGDPVKQQVGEKQRPGIGNRIGAATNGTFYSTYGPTPTHERSMEIADKEFNDILQQVTKILGSDIPALERALQAAGAPWVEGQSTPIGTEQ